MAHREPKVPTPGSIARRWFLFLNFYHFLPVIWYLAVAGGLAPGSFLFAAGIASLFSGDGDGFGMAAFLLASALAGGLIYYLAAWLLGVLIGRVKKPLVRTLILLALCVFCLIAAMQPIFISGGHSRTQTYSLFDFLEVLGEFQVPASYTIGYFSGLLLLLISLLVYQHLVAGKQAISAQNWMQRRKARRRIIIAGIIILLLSLGWTHRTLLFVKPLADLGFASAQYRLAMVLKEESIKRHGRPGAYQDWLVKAAEQGHLKAAQELVLHPRTRAEKLHWLPVAAEGGMAHAQYQLYRELLRATPEIESNRSAADWLKAAADSGHAEAQFDLGRAYLSFNPVLKLKRNHEMARIWWEKAAIENGFARAFSELAWRYEQGSDGFPRNAQRSIELYQSLAAGYRDGSNGLEQNPQLAADYEVRAERLIDLEERLAAGDPDAQKELGRALLQVANGSTETRTQGIRLLEQAAVHGDTDLQYELGAIFLFGRHDIAVDLPRGRGWWTKPLEKHHVKTMEYVAKAHQDGRFDYPIDLLKSRALAIKLVEAYRDGVYGVSPDSANARRWNNELKHIDRLFELAGGNYQSPDLLQAQAEAGDTNAQYQLGRQLLVGGPAKQREQGLQWIERAADGGLAEAQYQLVTYYERQSGIMRRNPARGIAMLKAAAEQNHLPAMGTLALGYEKGRYGLSRDLKKAKEWYERLLGSYAESNYLGEINERFIPFNRQRLIFVNQALEYEKEKTLRYENASPLERQIIEIEERYRERYQAAVNALPRGDGTREGKLQFQKEVRSLREKYNRLRDTEIERIKPDS